MAKYIIVFSEGKQFKVQELHQTEVKFGYSDYINTKIATQLTKASCLLLTVKRVNIQDEYVSLIQKM